MCISLEKKIISFYFLGTITLTIIFYQQKVLNILVDKNMFKDMKRAEIVPCFQD